ENLIYPYYKNRLNENDLLAQEKILIEDTILGFLQPVIKEDRRSEARGFVKALMEGKRLKEDGALTEALTPEHFKKLMSYCKEQLALDPKKSNESMPYYSGYLFFKTLRGSDIGHFWVSADDDLFNPAVLNRNVLRESVASKSEKGTTWNYLADNFLEIIGGILGLIGLRWTFKRVMKLARQIRKNNQSSSEMLLNIKQAVDRIAEKGTKKKIIKGKNTKTNKSEKTEIQTFQGTATYNDEIAKITGEKNRKIFFYYLAKKELTITGKWPEYANMGSFFRLRLKLSAIFSQIKIPKISFSPILKPMRKLFKQLSKIDFSRIIRYFKSWRKPRVEQTVPVIADRPLVDAANPIQERVPQASLPPVLETSAPSNFVEVPPVDLGYAFTLVEPSVPVLEETDPFASVLGGTFSFPLLPPVFEILPVVDFIIPQVLKELLQDPVPTPLETPDFDTGLGDALSLVEDGISSRELIHDSEGEDAPSYPWEALFLQLFQNVIPGTVAPVEIPVFAGMSESLFVTSLPVLESYGAQSEISSDLQRESGEIDSDVSVGLEKFKESLVIIVTEYNKANFNTLLDEDDVLKISEYFYQLLIDKGWVGLDSDLITDFINDLMLHFYLAIHNNPEKINVDEVLIQISEHLDKYLLTNPFPETVDTYPALHQYFLKKLGYEVDLVGETVENPLAEEPLKTFDIDQIKKNILNMFPGSELFNDEALSIEMRRFIATIVSETKELNSFRIGDFEVFIFYQQSGLLKNYLRIVIFPKVNLNENWLPLFTGDSFSGVPLNELGRLSSGRASKNIKWKALLDQHIIFFDVFDPNNNETFRQRREREIRTQVTQGVWLAFRDNNGSFMTVFSGQEANVAYDQLLAELRAYGEQRTPALDLNGIFQMVKTNSFPLLYKNPNKIDPSKVGHKFGDSYHERKIPFSPRGPRVIDPINLGQFFPKYKTGGELIKPEDPDYPVDFSYDPMAVLREKMIGPVRNLEKRRPPSSMSGRPLLDSIYEIVFFSGIGLSILGWILSPEDPFMVISFSAVGVLLGLILIPSWFARRHDEDAYESFKIIVPDLSRAQYDVLQKENYRYLSLLTFFGFVIIFILSLQNADFIHHIFQIFNFVSLGNVGNALFIALFGATLTNVAAHYFTLNLPAVKKYDLALQNLIDDEKRNYSVDGKNKLGLTDSMEIAVRPLFSANESMELSLQSHIVLLARAEPMFIINDLNRIIKETKKYNTKIKVSVVLSNPQRSFLKELKDWKGENIDLNIVFMEDYLGMSPEDLKKSFSKGTTSKLFFFLPQGAHLDREFGQNILTLSREYSESVKVWFMNTGLVWFLHPDKLDDLLKMRKKALLNA
ncbi:MAG: hypothetical protein ACKVQC_09845, partial [Elusimicrobiota bacterium]